MMRQKRKDQAHCREVLHASVCVTAFQNRDGASPEQNLTEFICMARNELTIYGADLDWKNWRWKHVGMFVKLGCPKRINVQDTWQMSPDFMDFAKAYMRHEQAMNPTKTDTRKARLVALRAIEHALTHEHGSAVPVDIGLGTLDHAAQLLRERLASATAYGAGRQLVNLARFLSQKGLTHTDTANWQNPIPAAVVVNVKLGAEADAHRLTKLPDIEALNAIGAIFARGFDVADNTNHTDVYVTSVVAMLMAQPGRIGEIHALAIDLEIEQRALDGSLQYGFRYISEKSTHSTSIKWIPSIWVPFAKEAVRRVREITDGPRAFALYVEEQLAAQKADPGTPLRFYRHARCPDVPDNKPLTNEQIVAALGSLSKKAYLSFVESRPKPLDRSECTLDALWLHVLALLPVGFPYIDRVANKRLKYSEALFCMYKGQLKKGMNYDPLSLWIPTQSTLHPQLAKSTPDLETIFERHCMTGEHGQMLRMTSHQLRHLLNTLAHEGSGDKFVDNATINWWSGRDQKWQGLTYNHVPAEEIACRAGAAFKRANGGQGVIELPPPEPTPGSMPSSHWSVTNPTPKSCADIEIHHRSAVLMTLWGSCEHDWMLEPCQFHQDCLNCKEHFCIKGIGKDSMERLGRLRELLSKVLIQQELARAAAAAGEFGADAYLTFQSSYRERIEQLIALLDSPSVAEGAVIRLDGASANSHLHRVLKEVALRDLLCLPGKTDLVDSLLLAYRENGTLPLDDASLKPIYGGSSA